MINDACKALKSNQCPQDWLNTQTFTNEEKFINNELKDISS
jgi:hypothetical protein